jgi:RND family efflux transporter MFP subunit
MKISSVLKLGVLLALAGMAVFVLLGRAPEAAVAAVKRGPAVNAVPATVAVRADPTTELRSEIAGRLITAAPAVGTRVRAGDTLARLDDADLKIELERLENQLRAESNRRAAGTPNEHALATARDDLARVQRQADAGTFPKADLENFAGKVKQLETAVALEKIERDAASADLENRLKAHQRLLAKTTVTAPTDAQVVAVLAHPGDLVAAGAPLAALLADARVVEASISEENYAGVAVGQKATVRFLGYGAEKYAATVAAVLPTADPATQRYTVRLDVTIAPEKLVPGLSGEAEVILGEHAAALLVPRRALLGEYVLVVKDGRVEQRRVKRGFASLTEAEIADGVAEGELVITDELDKFRAGDRVRVAQP